MNPPPYSPLFTSAHVRARIVKILLIVGAVATGMSLAAETFSLFLPPFTEEQEFADNPTGAAIVLTVFLFALLEALIYLTTVVFFLVWLYRASANVRAFQRWRHPEYSPGWAVGSFFVPFVNWVVPYRAVKDVWKKSGPPDEDLLAEPSPPAVFPIWWLFWLLASFAGNYARQASFNQNMPETTATKISIVAGGLSIVAALFAYLVVDAIDERQEETSAKVKLGKYSEPPPPPATLPLREGLAPTP